VIWSIRTVRILNASVQQSDRSDVLYLNQATIWYMKTYVRQTGIKVILGTVEPTPLKICIGTQMKQYLNINMAIVSHSDTLVILINFYRTTFHFRQFRLEAFDNTLMFLQKYFLLSLFALDSNWLAPVSSASEQNRHTTTHIHCTSKYEK